jgi:hypothetical protein
MRDMIEAVEDSPLWVKAGIAIGFGTTVGVVTAYIMTGMVW